MINTQYKINNKLFSGQNCNKASKTVSFGGNYYDYIFRDGAEEVERCMKFLNIAHSPQDFAQMVLKMTHGHPQQSGILWNIYREIGKKDIQAGGKSIGGWSAILWGSQENLAAQLEIFKNAFLKKPDIGEFNALTHYFNSEDKEHEIFLPLFKRGLNEIRNNFEDYSPLTIAGYLKNFVIYNQEKNLILSKHCANTALNITNDNLKEILLSYKTKKNLVDVSEAVEHYFDISGFYNVSIKDLRIQKQKIPYFEESNILIDEVSKIFREEDKTKKLNPLIVDYAKKITKLIDKHFKDYTIDNLYKYVEENGI